MIKIKEYVLKNTQLEVHVVNLGGTLSKIITSDINGQPVDVLLGFNSPEKYNSEDYLSDYPYLGATIGRYGNRIGGAAFSIHGQIYSLARNSGQHQLHGGASGFDRKYWDLVKQTETTLCLRYISEDGEEGFPGQLTVEVTYTLEGKDLRIDYDAVTDKTTHVSLTHHPYFNLNPKESDVRGHILTLYSNRYLKTNDMIPDGHIVDASGDYNFQEGRRLGDIIANHDGLDHCYVFSSSPEMTKMAKLFSPQSGITLSVYSDYPGIQVYTGKYLHVAEGKEGRTYGSFSGVALEAQYFPDSPNHPEFPSTLLEPGQKYRKTTIYSFM